MRRAIVPLLVSVCCVCLLFLSGCRREDPGLAAYKGPGQAKAGAPGMTPGGPGPGVTKPAAPVANRGGQRRK
jgi:hypothetical protein